MHDEHDTNRSNDDENPHAEISTRLRRALDDVTGDLPTPGGPAHAAARARTRRRHRHTALASAAAVALVASVTGVTLLDGSEDTDVATSPAAAVEEGGAELDWQVSDDGLNQVRSATPGDGAPLYALSTAPGTRFQDHPDGALPRALYRLGDDGSWEPIELDGDDPRIAKVSERDGVLYTLSTGTATSQDGRPLGSVSDDGGETWTNVPLADIDPPSDAVDWALSYSLDLASNDEATVAVVTSAFRVPKEQVFPELDDAPDGELRYVHQRDDGLALLREEIPSGDDSTLSREAEADPSGTRSTTAPPSSPDGDGDPATRDDAEVIRTVPWSELGVAGPDDLDGPTRAYVVDGEEWTEVGPPSGPDAGSMVSMQSAGEYIVLSRTSFDPPRTMDEMPTSRTTLHRTVDGQTWTPVNTPGPGQFAAAADALVHSSRDIASRGSEATIQVSRDAGATWRELDLSTLDSRVEDASLSVTGGPLGVAVAATRQDGEQTESLLLFSTDLQRWTVTDLTEVSPESSYFGMPQVGTDRVVVPGFGQPGTGDTPGETQTLVATPTRL